MDTYTIPDVIQVMQAQQQFLDALERRAQAGEEIYSDLVSLGVQTTEDDDTLRWRRAQLCALVTKRYGDNSLGKFAADIRLRRRTAYEYAQVWHFFPESARRALLDSSATLMYSHFRAAMRLGLALVKQGKAESAVDEALAFLDVAASEDWTPERAETEAAKAGGKAVLMKVVEFQARAKGDEYGAHILIEDKHGLVAGKRYIVRVYEDGAE